MVDKKKPTKKLGTQELEKRKAPFASPIVYRDEGGGGAPPETPTRREGPLDPPERSLPKPPIVHRTN